MTDQKTPRLIERSIDILLALTDGPQDLSTVCRESGLSKATVHRILAGLAYQGVVCQDPTTSRYFLGPGAVRLASSATASFEPLRIVARPVLEDLRTKTSETIILHVRMGNLRVNVEELISTQELRYSGGVGSFAPVHVGSAGKVLLAWLDDEVVRRILDYDLEQFTDTTITDPAALEAELRRVREDGFAESLGERIRGLAAVSVPVFSARAPEDVVASISLIGPEARMPADQRRALATVATEAAAAITGRMGAIT
jgi:DNA-binding IclR family transcriptional regulator